jgi:hypothetical protein
MSAVVKSNGYRKNYGISGNARVSDDFYIATPAEIYCSCVARVEHIVLIKIDGRAKRHGIIYDYARSFSYYRRISFY